MTYPVTRKLFCSAVVVAGLAVSSVASAALNDNLELYLQFNGNATDTSGNGATTSINGSPLFVSGVSAETGQALNFPNPAPLGGTTPQYVNAGSAANLNFGTDTDFSIQAWVNTTSSFPDDASNHNDPGILSNKNWNSGANQGWFIGAGGNGRLQWNIGDGGRMDYDGPGGQINDGNWHHIVWTLDRDGSTVTYLDNVVVNTQGATNTLNLDTPDGFQTRVATDGEAGATWPAFFPGTIDEAAIWSRALSASDVTILYNVGSGVDINNPPEVDPLLKVTIDRDTGAMTLENNTSENVVLQGYSIASPDGALDPGLWTSIAGNYDASGDKSVDSDDNWTRLTAAEARGDLSEFQFGGNGATLAHSQVIDLGPSNPGPPGPWIQYYKEDLTFQYTTDTGGIINGLLEFTGTNDPFAFGDLDFDGDIDIDDWVVFTTGFETSLAGLSQAEAYRVSDLNGDGQRDTADFLAFRTAYDGALGEGAFQAMIAGVPEPLSASLALLGFGALVLTRCRKRNSVESESTPPMIAHSRRPTISTLSVGSVFVAVLLCCLGNVTHAGIKDGLVGLYQFDGGASDASGSANVNDGTEVATVGTLAYSTGRIGQALDVDGGAYVNLGKPADYDFGDTVAGTDVDLSISMWINQDGNVSDPAVFSNKNWDNGGLTGINFAPKGTGIFDLNTKGDSGARVDLDGGGNSASTGVGVWSHVLVTIDRDGLMSMWINGTLTGTTTSSQGSFTAPSDGGGLDWNIGQDGTGTYGINWEGLVDDVGIWRRALLPGEVGAIYQSGLAGTSIADVEVSYLEVNTVSGSLTIHGGSSEPNITSYEITSAKGVLDSANFVGLGSIDAVEDPTGDTPGPGNDPGETWETLVATDNQLFEGFLLGSSLFDGTRSESLGKGFDTSTAEGDRDVVFIMTTLDGTTMAGLVEYVDTPGGNSGDFDLSGMVDQGDLDLVLLNWGDTSDPPPAGWVNDLPTSPTIGPDDLDRVRQNWGNTSGVVVSSAVPEPSTLALLVVLGLLGLPMRR